MGDSMKHFISLALAFLALPAFAKVEYKNSRAYVTGEDVLQDQQINQYDDVNEPPQGYVVTIPDGYTLNSVDVDGGDSAVCGIKKYDYKNQTIEIYGFSLETDEQGCTVILNIGKKGSKEVKNVNYYIEQVGT
jgi:hypothetical protein